MSKPHILLVDDDSRFLTSMQRSLGRQIPLLCAESPENALDLFEEQTISVVISDMRMPGGNGIELLSTIKTAYPDTIRILLTGFANQQTAIEAVNRGAIFRFLTKPCEIALLEQVISDASRQYQLITAERELLEKTLLGAVGTLSQALSMVNPSAQQRAARIQDYCRQLAHALQREDLWFFEMSALLSQIGCLNVPANLLDNNLAGHPLAADEKALIDTHPAMAEELLKQIPRLEEVARAIALQQQPFSFYTTAAGRMIPEQTALAAQVLHLCLEFDRQTHYQARSPEESIRALEADSENYNPLVTTQLKNLKRLRQELVQTRVYAHELTMSMVLCEDIRTHSGLLLASQGQQLTDFLLIGIKNYASKIGVNEPFSVLAPAATARQAARSAGGT